MPAHIREHGNGQKGTSYLYHCGHLLEMGYRDEFKYSMNSSYLHYPVRAS